MKSKTSITQLMSLLGAFAAAALAVSIPGVYYAISTNGEKRVITTEAAFVARSVGKIIQARPDLWEFETVRLKELISKPSLRGATHEGEIRTAAGKLVVRTDSSERRPIISVSEPFFDSGRLAGSVTLRRSIRPQVITTALLGLLSSLFGALLYFIFRVYPVRKLENTLAELQRAHDEMEQRVADRTEALSNANRELQEEIILRKRVEEALRESEVKHRVIFEGSTQGILVNDFETKRIVLANPASCRMLGYSEDELLGLGAENIHPGDIMDRILSAMESQARGENPLSYAIPCLRKDGTVFYADIVGSDTVIQGRKCVVGFFTDVTSRKALEDGVRKAYDDLKNVQTQLVQSGKLASIGELAAGVAHELNQPLMIIRSLAQLTLRQQRKNALDTAQLLDNMSLIEKNTKRMMNIINHLRTFSRQTKGAFAPVNVNEVIQDSFLMIGEQLHLRNIQVIREFSNDVPMVSGNANQLEQVFLNLLANARDAIETKFEARERGSEFQKKIVIATRFSGDANEVVEILFRDTGSGITEEILPNIFDPFFTTKKVGEGTGLGLSISYGIIQDHEGEIDVPETGPEGTTFRIRLPIQMP